MKEIFLTAEAGVKYLAAFRKTLCMFETHQARSLAVTITTL
jgi:hypothetical protein